MDAVERAQRLADEVLFPASLATDAAAAVPPELLDALAEADLYGVGADGDFATVCAVQEALAACRAEPDRLDPARIAAARARAGELALRAGAALAAANGSRSLLRAEHAQRLVREALFCLVYALRPESRVALLGRLGAAR